ncbi:NmrA-like family [Seminavis robusta]|uniref:NmrA-like family n=1 Tax=Seminavis robusta TaxID=568900 RepID=A0A9N8HB51_9STRA|nr:NmrA-like family [Seminavis robusta]|eukprot:Sro248_g098520.1 NmrA-like family (350) ;mRNA; f:80958-82007
MPPADNSKSSVLVTLATGKLGLGICEAFLGVNDGDNAYVVHGTSRNPQHPALLSRGIQPIEFQFGSKESIERALNIANPDVVVVITALIQIAKSVSAEVEHARIILDACKDFGSNHPGRAPPHVIFCSSHSATKDTPDRVPHFKSKYFCEEYLRGLDIPHSILKPASFMENFDDPTVYNPLTYGTLRDLYPIDTPVPLVGTLDVGKAAVAMVRQSMRHGEKVPCISIVSTGRQSAECLSQASGTPGCSYQTAPPRFVQYIILRDLYHMVSHVGQESAGDDCYQDEMKAFRELVPKPMSLQEWFQKKGKWADGTPFGEKPTAKSMWDSKLVLVASSAVLVAVAWSWRSRS